MQCPKQKGAHSHTTPLRPSAATYRGCNEEREVQGVFSIRKVQQISSAHVCTGAGSLVACGEGTLCLLPRILVWIWLQFKAKILAMLTMRGRSNWLRVTTCDSWAFLVAQMVQNPPAMQRAQVQSLGQEDPLEREWQSTPVFLPGEPHGQRGLVGCSPWGRKESDTVSV